MIADFTLSEHDKSTGVWVRLKAHLEDRLANARHRNDRAQSEQDTALIRGEIRALKALIGLDAVRPLVDDE